MARPRKTGLDYFPHDVDARNDDKLAALRHLYGNDGYAFYFIILEMSFSGQNPGITLEKKLLFTIVQKEVGVERGLFEEMIQTSVELGLFDSKAWEERQVLISKRIRAQFEAINNERKRKRRNSGETPEKLRKNATKKSKAFKPLTPLEKTENKIEKEPTERPYYHPPVYGSPEWEKEYGSTNKK